MRISAGTGRVPQIMGLLGDADVEEVEVEVETCGG